MQKLAYYAKHKFYKNDLLEPSIIKNSTVIQIHFLSNLVSSRYLTYQIEVMTFITGVI